MVPADDALREKRRNGACAAIGLAILLGLGLLGVGAPPAQARARRAKTAMPVGLRFGASLKGVRQALQPRKIPHASTAGTWFRMSSRMMRFWPGQHLGVGVHVGTVTLNQSCRLSAVTLYFTHPEYGGSKVEFAKLAKALMRKLGRAKRKGWSHYVGQHRGVSWSLKAERGFTPPQGSTSWVMKLYLAPLRRATRAVAAKPCVGFPAGMWVPPPKTGSGPLTLMPMGLKPGMSLRDALQVLKRSKVKVKPDTLQYNAARCRHEQHIALGSGSLWGLPAEYDFSGCSFRDGLLQGCKARKGYLSEPPFRKGLARLKQALGRRYGPLKSSRRNRNGDGHRLIFRKGRTTVTVEESTDVGMTTMHYIELSVRTRLRLRGCSARAKLSPVQRAHKTRVRKVLARRRGRVLRCLRPLPGRRPPPGKPLYIWVRFQLDSFGKPHGVGAGASRAVRGLACVRRRLAKQRFPVGPQPTQVRHRFHFRPKELRHAR